MITLNHFIHYSIGGIISAEVIKLITFKYTPIDQWFEFYDNDIKIINDSNLLNVTKPNILWLVVEHWVANGKKFNYDWV